MMGTYIRGEETHNFNFGTDLSVADKQRFVNSVVSLVVDDENKRYNSILRDLIFNFYVVDMLTDVDTTELKESSFFVNDVEWFLEETNIEEHIKNADIVVTGEGRLDAQTVMGKAPIGVARIAKKYGKKVIAFCGCTGEGAELVLRHGIDGIYPITPPDTPLEEALNPTQAYRNLRNTVQCVLRELL